MGISRVVCRLLTSVLIEIGQIHGAIGTRCRRRRSKLSNGLRQERIQVEGHVHSLDHFVNGNVESASGHESVVGERIEEGARGSTI